MKTQPEIIWYTTHPKTYLVYRNWELKRENNTGHAYLVYAPTRNAHRKHCIFTSRNDVSSPLFGGAVADVPGEPWDVPGLTCDVPKPSWDLPGLSWDVPGLSQDVPGPSWDVPGQSWDVPGLSRERKKPHRIPDNDENRIAKQ